MLRLNRKTEYALISLEHMALKEKEIHAITSVREVSEAYKIPNPVLAKVMQKLANHGLIKSVHGTKGGYVLTKKPEDVTVVDIIQIFDGSLAVAGCFGKDKITCPQWDGCLIKDPFYELNHKIHELLANTSIADLAAKHEEQFLASQESHIPV